MQVLKAVADPNQFSDELWTSFTAEDRKLLRIVYPAPKEGVRSAVLPLFPRIVFAELLTEIYECYQELDPRTLAKNMLEKVAYCAGGRKNTKQGFPNLFRKNIIRLYPWVSGNHAPSMDVVGFPRTGGYSLLDPRNYKAKYAPHEDLHRKGMKKLLLGVSEGVITTAGKLTLPHADGEGVWTIDERVILREDGGRQKSYWNFEPYTGSEGYGEFFIRRLFPAKRYEQESFVFLFRVVGDVTEAKQAVRRHNEQQPEGTKEPLPLVNTYFYCYKRIEDLRRSMWIGKGTKTRG